jgi:phosphoribosylaminoimidazolecarboxamide formyltransferase / IMP cyclohydrolase
LQLRPIFINLAFRNTPKPKKLKKIKKALISVYYKDRLEEIISVLNHFGVELYSTGGTYDFIVSCGIEARTIESLTGYPGILGGRVKTLHPKVFGGILARPDHDSDLLELDQYEIPLFDLVIVDLYPFAETLSKTTKEDEIIEKIDIGGISLIRAAAKNSANVLIVPSSDYYDELLMLLQTKQGQTELVDRKRFAAYAFAVSSSYDTNIFNWMNGEFGLPKFRQSIDVSRKLRYGENPHQEGSFFGKLENIFEQLHGKELSYNNLLDLEAGLSLVQEFNEPSFAILKHNNACGLASRHTIGEAYAAALAGDPVSAFGGVLVSNRLIDENSASLINELFFEIIIAPGFDKNALSILETKKNRIILQQKEFRFPLKQFRSLLGGVLEQDRDLKTENEANLNPVTALKPGIDEITDLIFANKIVKHTRSNAIVLVKNKQMLGSGIGQTSRVDALKQAIAKARENGFDLQGAVIASDAFFPFSDSVKLAAEAGIRSVVQPGGSVRDQDSIDYCNQAGISMVFTGTRHFKH